jgi:hypothetical protein
MTENHTALFNALRSAQSGRSGDDAHVEDALRLVLAFMRIQDTTARRSIVDVVERIAGHPDGGSKAIR